MSVTELRLTGSEIEGNAYPLWLHMKNLIWWLRSKNNYSTNHVWFVESNGYVHATERTASNTLAPIIRLG